MDEPQTIVIGGGLAGLTAAATLSRAGRPVIVLEAAEHVGGRARTPPARRLRPQPRPARPVPGRRWPLRLAAPRRPRAQDGCPRVDRAASCSTATSSRHSIIAALDKATVLGLVKALAGLGERAAAPWAGRPAEEWLDTVSADHEGRAMVASVVRTATYSADHDVARRRRGHSAAARRRARGALRAPRLVDARRGLDRRHPRRRRAHPDRGTGRRRRSRRCRPRRAAGRRRDDRRGGRRHRRATIRVGRRVCSPGTPRRVLGARGRRRRAGAHGPPRPRAATAAANVGFRTCSGIDEPVFLTVQSSVADVAPGRRCRGARRRATSARTRRAAITAPGSSACSTPPSRTGATTSSTPATCRDRWSPATTLARPRSAPSAGRRRRDRRARPRRRRRLGRPHGHAGRRRDRVRAAAAATSVMAASWRQESAPPPAGERS